MINYRRARIDDMPMVAFVHVQAQPEYFTTLLGKDLLTKFYKEYLLEDNLFIVACDANQNNRIVGFCMGYYVGTKARENWERKYKWQIICKLLYLCLTLHASAIIRCVDRIKNIINAIWKHSAVQKNNKGTNNITVDLLSIDVLKEYRRQKIASNLIDNFEILCRQSSKEVAVYTLSTYKWNKTGRKFYAFKGFRVFKTTNDSITFIKKL